MDFPEILNTLRCSQCECMLSVFPVHCYKNGDFVCGRCTPIPEHEPRQDLGYEALAQGVNFPCSYKLSGCMENRTPSEIKLHESLCCYKTFSCPFSLCKWQGMSIGFEDHCTINHSKFLLKDSTKFSFENEDGIWKVNGLFNQNEQLFLLQIEKTDGKITASIYLLSESGKTYYNYTMTVLNKNEVLLKIPDEKVYNNYGMILTQPKKLQRFDMQKLDAHKNEILICDVKITKNYEYKNKPIALSPVDKHILKLLKCPMCVQDMSAPIFQCTNGHVICNYCKLKFTNCKSCSIGDSRNVVLEGVAKLIQYKCRYDGCEHISTYQTKNTHEIECIYSPYKCPFETCNVIKYYTEILHHVRTTHIEECLQNALSRVSLKQNKTTRKISQYHVLIKDKSIFTLHCSVDKINFKIYLKHYGPKEEFNKYFYIFDAQSKDMYQRLNIKSKCLDWNQEPTHYNCIQLFTNMLSPYENGGDFIYKITIVNEDSFKGPPIEDNSVATPRDDGRGRVIEESFMSRDPKQREDTNKGGRYIAPSLRKL